LQTFYLSVHFSQINKPNSDDDDNVFLQLKNHKASSLDCWTGGHCLLEHSV